MGFIQDARIIQYLQSKQYDTSHQQTGGKMLHHLNRCRNNFWQNLISIYDKIPTTKCIEGLNCNITKAISYSQYHTIKVKKLKHFPLRSRAKQGCPQSPLLFNTVLKVSRHDYQTKEIKKYELNEDIKLSLFSNTLKITYGKSYDTTKTLLILINESNKAAEYS